MIHRSWVAGYSQAQAEGPPNLNKTQRPGVPRHI
jgi:hypothetical protein